MTMIICLKDGFMKETAIIDFLKKNIKPLEDNIYGKKYQATVTLNGNLVIPCVQFLNTKKITDLAIKRFEEERKKKGILKYSKNPYNEIVRHFLTKQNVITSNEIIQLKKSRNAFPLELFKKIHGETLMSWTGFVLRMSDGNYFNFGTTFSFDFFELPDNYEFSDVTEIINHSYIDESGKIQNYRKSWKSAFENHENLKIYREMTYFNCYLNGIS